jgi:F-box/WD-40 domain protein MET30
MLFSASDDGTIKLWDLTLRTCVRVFAGHVGQVQSMKLLLAGECGVDDDPDEKVDDGDPATESSPGSSSGGLETTSANGTDKLATSAPASLMPTRKKPLLISGSLDNTIKIWDIDTSEAVSTFFGHIEGVWAVASDKLRLVSGSHDRTIKVIRLFLLARVAPVLTTLILRCGPATKASAPLPLSGIAPP